MFRTILALLALVALATLTGCSVAPTPATPAPTVSAYDANQARLGREVIADLAGVGINMTATDVGVAAESRHTCQQAPGLSDWDALESWALAEFPDVDPDNAAHVASTELMWFCMGQYDRILDATDATAQAAPLTGM